MQIIIDIPEEKYTKLVMEEEHIRACGSYYPVMILDGTQLPEGHGRLIDADNLIKLYEAYCGNNCPYSKKEREFMCRACQTGDAIEMLEDEPTIIPADKEKEE